MKKYILILMFMFGLFGMANTNAQTYYYKTLQFSMKYKTNGIWTNWSNWESSNLTLSIDLDNDVITVYSEKRQIYRVLENMGSYTDESQGRQTKFYVVDQDGDFGYVRLRIEKNGNSQLYVDFGDICWVYNVRRI